MTFQEYNDLLKKLIKAIICLSCIVYFLFATSVTFCLFYLSLLLRS